MAVERFALNNAFPTITSGHKIFWFYVLGCRKSDKMVTRIASLKYFEKSHAILKKSIKKRHSPVQCKITI